MDAEDVTTAEELVRRYAPELIPELKREIRIDAHVTAFVLSAMVSYWVLALVVGTGGDLSQPLTFILPAGITAAGAYIAERAVRRRHQSKSTAFSRELSDSPWRIYGIVASKFALEIERQRARTLGPESEWGCARRPLENAAQEADRSVAYWQQRAAMDSSNPLARQQHETAEALRRKFQGALAELDARAQVLLSFFNECEARVAVLQYAKRDVEETRKLGSLSERADDIVAIAGITLAGIGTAFLTEAIRVGNALGGLERVGILNAAETVPVDQIELLADRILESSVRERSALERLAKEVSP
ncbi:MAG: hypothetical protein WEE89_21910 [Gemmatimonadota bacterium]